MDIVLILVFLLLFIKIRLKTESEDYLDKKQTASINGFFIILVFICHFSSYVELNNQYDKLFLLFYEKICQLVVTTFLFYSGYGVMKSIQNKGESYIRSMPKNRILKTFITFGIAIMLYVLIDLVIGEKLKLSQVLLAFIGWTSIGNSNWYIFAILIMYILTWLSFRIKINKSHFWSIFLNSVLVCAYVIVIMNYKESRFYNTVLCYVLGMWFAFFKPWIDRFLKKNWVYGSVIGVTLLIFVYTYINKDANLIFNQLMYLLFVLCIVLVTMKVVIGNCILDWCGSHLMPLFILQRIPMLVFGKYTYFMGRPYLYFGLSFVITVIMAWLFDKYISNGVEKVFNRNSGKKIQKSDL